VTDFDNLLAQIDDEDLRSQLKARVDLLTRQMRFGLVFERHIPESIRDYSASIAVGSIVQLRSDINGGDEFTVERVARSRADIVSTSGVQRQDVPVRELVSIKRFGEGAYPALKPLGSIRRHAERPSHAVINGENFHALQLLRYLYRGQVDCIYIDPPYNTGNSDWKYNNRYIDDKDRWRHSKWLSFMERRLEIARDLLKPDGVLIVTIDEHEVHHLGVLLEQIFPSHLHYTVSIVMNPKGTGKVNFSRVNEYALYCVPDTGESVIRGLPPEEADVLVGKRTQEHQELEDDDEDLEDPVEEGAQISSRFAPEDLPFPVEELPLWELRHARRRGNESGYRHQRPNQFYPLYIDVAERRVVSAGTSPPLDEAPDFAARDGLVPLWPIDKDDNERCWRYIPDSMQERIDAGQVVLSGNGDVEGGTWTVNYWTPRVDRKKYKTVWWSKQHDAGTHGTTLLPKFLGKRNAFPFPKSLYAVRDTLLSVVRDRPDALILDFFAGSGTTLHATALINATDDGSRRCLLVTNNEVEIKTARRLVRDGHLPGNKKFEQHGIFWQATRPRCEAAITGRTPNGKPVPGVYADLRQLHADGFAENVEFFELHYLDKDAVRQGSQFSAIEPSLWLASGGVGTLPSSDESEKFSIPEGSNYGVLFERAAFAQFKRALAKRPDVSHVFLVTDSETAYSQMCSRLDMSAITPSMLYRDYLTNFRINTLEANR
jgi:adenine-specific DNA-methyltransferase